MSTFKRQHIGRPSKLTASNKSKILANIRLGVPAKTACCAAGVDYTTFRRWVQIAKGEVSPPQNIPLEEFVDFFADFERAQCEGEIELVKLVHAAAHIPKNWKAATYLLEKINPEVWSPQKNSLEDVALVLAKSGIINSDQFERLIEISKETTSRVGVVIGNVNSEAA